MVSGRALINISPARMATATAVNFVIAVHVESVTQNVIRDILAYLFRRWPTIEFLIKWFLKCYVLIVYNSFNPFSSG